MSAYPEHDKLAKVDGESQVIGAFLDWLTNEHGAFLCRHHTHDDACDCADPWYTRVQLADPLRCPTCDSIRRATRHHVCGMLEMYPNPIHRSIEDWLALYFDIDPGRLEEEKRAMLGTCEGGQGQG